MSKPTKKRQNKKNKREELNLQHKLFIHNYTNIDNPKTFNNGTQSYKATYPGVQLDTANSNASRLLSKGNIQDSIELMVKELQLGPKVRLQAIKEVISGRHNQTTTSTTKQGRKILYKSTSVKSPSANEVIRAVDLVEKITGTYDKNRAKADVMSSELKSLLRRHRKELTGTRGGGK